MNLTPSMCIELGIFLLVWSILISTITKKLSNKQSFSKKTIITNTGKNNLIKNYCNNNKKTITINGATISNKINGNVRTIIQSGNSITVNGVEISELFEDCLNVTINLEGDVETIKTDNADINITGNVSGSVMNTNGNIKCVSILGNAENKNGNIKAKQINGDAKTHNGNIKK